MNDRAFIFKQFSDPKVNMYLYDEEPLTSIEGADEIINFYLSGDQQERWMIELKSTGEIIGTCGFHCWNKEQSSVEVGYDLQSSHWNKGYMSEIMPVLITYIREVLNVHLIQACIAVNNIGSIKLVEKFNFKQVGNVTYEFREKEYLHYIYQLNC